MKITRTGAFAGGVVMTLVLGGGTAVAANGGSFLLGRSNTATATTTLNNANGTPLALNGKVGIPPLTVNSEARVTKLNADKLDGLSSGSFLRSTGKAADADRLDGLSSGSFLRSGGKALDADKVDGIDGAALALKGGRTGIIWGSETDVDGYANTARCPNGTYATGGGGHVTTDGDALAYSGPDFDANDNLIPNSWFVDANEYTVAFVTCYNPRGAVPGAATKAPWAQPAAAAKASASSQKRVAALGRR